MFSLLHKCGSLPSEGGERSAEVEERDPVFTVAPQKGQWERNLKKEKLLFHFFSPFFVEMSNLLQM